MEKSITVGSMRELVKESQGQFKALIGDGVESENKKNNEKSYKDAKTKTDAKEVKPEHKVPEKTDGNKTTLDYTFATDPGKQYKERVHAQAKGYTSKAEEENGIEKNAEFADDFYKAAKKAGDDIRKAEKEFKKSGLQARELPDEVFDKENMYESRKIQTVRFKRTEFLTEEHMMSKIPDEMKTEGKVFRMKDKNDKTYIVEWTKNKWTGKENGKILGQSDEKKVNESLERMKALYSFRAGSDCQKTTAQERLYENNEGFQNTLDKMRRLMK